VTGVRADGYHLIDAEMVTVDLEDTLSFDVEGNDRGDGRDGLEITGPASADVPADGTNLVRRALDLAGRRAHVTVDKRIPPGAGLGGGSADAAAVLRWAGIDDPNVAAKLGADVPFCLRGGRAKVTGIGEQLEPLAGRTATTRLDDAPAVVRLARLLAQSLRLVPGGRRARALREERTDRRGGPGG
jgi:4-diphosphocytidyl-2-C-methyl-D-erythritol kinase